MVGSGSMGRRHMACIVDHFPTADVEIVPSRSVVELEGDGCESRPVVHGESLRARAPDAVVIASAAPHHVALASAALSHSIPVLIEKPLSDRLEGTDELRELASSSGVPALLGYCLRFSRAFQVVSDVLRGGRLGNLLSTRFDCGSYLPAWRPGTDYRSSVSARRELGGGALLELSHEIDLALCFGGAADTTTGLLRNTGLLGIDVEDTAELVLGHAEGVVGSVHLDFIRRPPTRTALLVGSEGVLLWDLLADSVVMRQHDGSSEVLMSRDTSYPDMYEVQMRHFMDCVRQVDEPRCTVDDGRAVLEVCEAVRRHEVSSREGRS